MINALKNTFAAFVAAMTIGTLATHADLPSPKTGGVDGKPINLLVISSTSNKVRLIFVCRAAAPKVGCFPGATYVCSGCDGGGM